MSDLEAFKSEVEAFLAEARIAPSRFGTAACGDSAFVIDLRNGREPRFSTIERVRSYMREQRRLLKSLQKVNGRPAA